MAYKKTDKLIEYNNNYNREKYDRFSLMLPKGKKEEIQKALKKTGDKSINFFVNRLIDEELDKIDRITKAE